MEIHKPRKGYEVIRRVLRGERIGESSERKLREFLENYNGEVN